ncbi:MAG: hypothetical protein GXY14_10120 [Spirochaetes bacterium]|nr:hypothetical protein [Spirochaetota bacterium]
MKYFRFIPALAALVILSFLFCGREVIKNNPPDDDVKSNGYNETFKKTGWISDTKYRAVIYILTYEECIASTREQIEEKIKYEAIKHLQSEMKIIFTRNQSAKASTLMENYGLMSPDEINCTENNIFFYDIEKKDLKLEFQNIKNTK